jgi:hypothetical protein
MAPSVAWISLPLNWFPAGQTVDNWFPFQATDACPGDVFARVRVHIAKRFDLAPFAAPSGLSHSMGIVFISRVVFVQKKTGLFGKSPFFRTHIGFSEMMLFIEPLFC